MSKEKQKVSEKEEKLEENVKDPNPSENKIKELEEKVEELSNKYLYALAEMRDLHKTYEKENMASLRYLTQELIYELLPMYDIFSIVLESSVVPPEVAAYLKGFELVFNQFKQFFENKGVKEIETKVGDEFNHNIHNGVEATETENQELDKKISQVLLKGYKINDKVLRPASVKVYKYLVEEVKEEKPNEEVIENNKGE